MRRDFLGEIKSVAAAASADAKVRSYGELAMITGHRKAADNNDVFFLDIWARQKGSWHALLMQNVAAAPAEPPLAAPAAAGGEPKQHECKNPCQAIPYRVRSAAEQDVINTYQAIVKAIVAHDASEWAKHVADEFVLQGRPGAGREIRPDRRDRAPERRAIPPWRSARSRRCGLQSTATAR